MKLSVVVCTHNRVRMLMACLDSIRQSIATAALSEAEIVVVDNASKDDTTAEVKTWANTHTIPVNLAFEPRKGLSKARNRALRVAKGDLILWTDDDCRLDKDCIQNALRHVANDREPVFRGGRVQLGDPSDVPFSIKTHDAKQRWHKVKHPQKYIEVGGAFLGANMMMPRALVDKLGFFDERFGAGAAIPAGEESDYIARAYLSGIMIEYVPDVTVFHYHGRKSIGDVKKLMQGYMIAGGAVYAKHFLRSPNFCRPVYRNFKGMLREMRLGKNDLMPEIGFSRKDLFLCNMKGVAKYCVNSMTPL